MLNTILTYGIAAGLIVGIPLSALVLAGPVEASGWGMAIGYATMLVALSLIAVAVKRRRDAQGGVIRFWPALGLGLGISVVAGIVYVIAWDTALAISGQDFAAAYGRAIVEQQRAAGATAAELARVEADMAAFRRSYANPLFRWPMTFVEIAPVGVLVSLVTAALFRNPRFLPARTR